VDTSNILFVCGGTFNGLDKIIRNRIGSKLIGFEADIKGKGEIDIDEIMSVVQPEDLIKFGLIPEFIGRIPIVATLNELSLDALVRILTEPKNALIKQYKKLFELEHVNLKFTDAALLCVAKAALERKSGARGLRAILESVMLDIMYEIPSSPEIQERGLRAILESVMLDIMYEIPSSPEIQECVIGEEVITRGESPLLLYENQVEYA